MEINLNGLENKAEYKNDTITNIKNEIMDNFSNIENKFSKVSSLGPRAVYVNRKWRMYRCLYRHKEHIILDKYG